MANWRLGPLWCNGYPAPTIPCLAFHIIPHRCSVRRSTQSQVRSLCSSEWKMRVVPGRHWRCTSCLLFLVKINCSGLKCLHLWSKSCTFARSCWSLLLGWWIVYVWTQCLCLHSWGVCKDERCVSGELTFNLIASGVTVHLTGTTTTFIYGNWHNEQAAFWTEMEISDILWKNGYYTYKREKDILVRKKFAGLIPQGGEQDGATASWREERRQKRTDRWGDRGRELRGRRGLNLLGGLEIKALCGKVIIESARLMIRDTWIHQRVTERFREREVN